jgi:hypothetical protein
MRSAGQKAAILALVWEKKQGDHRNFSAFPGIALDE